jgi:hypothetical protein
MREATIGLPCAIASRIESGLFSCQTEGTTHHPGFADRSFKVGARKMPPELRRRVLPPKLIEKRSSASDHQPPGALSCGMSLKEILHALLG